MRLIIFLILLCSPRIFALEKNPGPDDYCSFARFGDDFKEPLCHGSSNCYQCKTCSDDDTSAICPRCRDHCHQGHDVITVEPAPYFCDCGAGIFGSLVISCQLMPGKEPTCANLASTINPRVTYLTWFKKLAHPQISLTLSIATIKEQISLSDAIDQENTPSSISSSVYLAEEEFVRGFDANHTKKRIIHNAMDATWSWPFMHDYTRTDYRYIQNKQITAAELPYVSGHKLIIMIASPNEKHSIFFMPPELWDEAITQLLSTPRCLNIKPLFIPKILLKNEAKPFLCDAYDIAEISSGLNSKKTQTDALFNLNETGSTSISKASSEIINSEVNALIFNRPMLAIILDQKDQILVTTYINFDN